MLLETDIVVSLYLPIKVKEATPRVKDFHTIWKIGSPSTSCCLPAASLFQDFGAYQYGESKFNVGVIVRKKLGRRPRCMVTICEV